ncbi:hypothetical protein [Modestobacter italicus]|uniref:hypothetical protein n=1 Tax=Modestobacter italicus (strain DSM 44449 / CECT 9708 / BC 501) TaxID=2732864 RepID=UPI001C952503|nr:hypothetical protein [Modestobacter italicus]
MPELDPQGALTEVRRRRAQALDEGSAPWPRRFVAALVLACLTIGAARDADMNWLVPWMVILLGLASQLRGVRLPRTGRSRRWAVAWGAALIGAGWLGVVVMHLARTADWPLPGTIGGVVAALVVVFGVGPLQAREARSLRG